MERPSLKPLAVLAIASSLFAPAGRVAQAESTWLDRRAEAIVREVLATDAARGTLPGIVVVRRTDRLAARNLTRPMIPASIQKLATTATALMRFGRDHRFTTRVLGYASDLDGSVGHLALVGGGDPTLATTAFRDRYLTRRKGMAPDQTLFPSGSPTIALLAARIKATGVTRVRGNLIADDSLFDRVRTQVGWKSSYLNGSTGGPYVGYISALVVNQGYGDLEQKTVAASPAAFTADKLRTALRQRGIVVEGRIVYRTAPVGGSEVAQVVSPPLGEIVRWINRWSANHPAELLLKGLGAAFAGEGSTAGGRRVVRRALAAAGVDITDFRLEDGSGLSLADRMTPRMVAGILRWALYSDSGAAYSMRHSLAIACRFGTLLMRMCDTRAEGNLRGKTGMVTDVRAMAGWVRGDDGVQTVYVAIFNRAPNEGALTSTLDLLGKRLARFP